MQSSENPDLAFRPPASWTRGRVTRPRLIVIHATQGSERATSAEDGAAYDARRTDGTSTHYFHDATSSVQCVYTSDTAHAALRTGNRIGIHHELCGRAEQSAEQWADPASAATLVNAARIAARDAKRWGIPVRRLTAAQVRAGMAGFCGHREITDAFPEDHGTHWDPGPHFPWPWFLTLVAGFANQPPPATTPPATDVNRERTRSIVKALPTLRQGSAGTPVRRLQALANVAGSRLQDDGLFGPKTAAAVEQFQRARGLVPDRVVGPLTWAKLLGV